MFMVCPRLTGSEVSLGGSLPLLSFLSDSGEGSPPTRSRQILDDFHPWTPLALLQLLERVVDSPEKLAITIPVRRPVRIEVGETIAGEVSSVDPPDARDDGSATRLARACP